MFCSRGYLTITGSVPTVHGTPASQHIAAELSQGGNSGGFLRNCTSPTTAGTKGQLVKCVSSRGRDSSRQVARAQVCPSALAVLLCVPSSNFPPVMDCVTRREAFLFSPAFGYFSHGNRNETE